MGWPSSAGSLWPRTSADLQPGCWQFLRTAALQSSGGSWAGHSVHCCLLELGYRQCRVFCLCHYLLLPQANMIDVASSVSSCGIYFSLRICYVLRSGAVSLSRLCLQPLVLLLVLTWVYKSSFPTCATPSCCPRKPPHSDPILLHCPAVLAIGSLVGRRHWASDLFIRHSFNKHLSTPSLRACWFYTSNAPIYFSLALGHQPGPSPSTHHQDSCKASLFTS